MAFFGRPISGQGRARGVERRTLLLAGAAAALGGGLIACRPPAPRGEFASLGLGLDQVQLTDAEGVAHRWRELKGAPRALFFGFTNCPVICPVTVYELTAALDRLGDATAGVMVHFITIDPERDTPQRLHDYFSGFGPRVRAFTGAAEAIGRIALSFEVTAERSNLPGGDYSMDHTTTVFLLNSAGAVADVVAYGAPAELIDQRLAALAAGV